MRKINSNEDQKCYADGIFIQLPASVIVRKFISSRKQESKKFEYHKGMFLF